MSETVPMLFSDSPAQLTLDIRLDSGASFDNYYGGANAETVAAVRALAQGRSESPLYVYGARGLGKSHLLQAACRAASERGLQAGYLPLRMAVEWSTGFADGLETLSLVAVDDVDAIAGSPSWQEALFHLFNRLRETGGAMLLAASARPAELGLQLNDLVSRLQWGLVLRLQEHDDASKIELLRFRSGLRGLDLPEDTAAYLLARYPRELPTLLDLLERLDRASLSAQRRLTIPFVKQVLAAEPQGGAGSASDA